jgi:hypothetical protein
MGCLRPSRQATHLNFYLALSGYLLIIILALTFR